MPGEAQQIVEKGIQAGTLKSADKTEQGRYDRLLAGAKKQSDLDQASLTQLAKEAEKATQGQADVALGQAYLSYGKLDEAIAALERGIKKGGVTDIDEAQVSLGIAYLKKGQKDQARQAFKAVKQGKWSDLAELWSIRTYRPEAHWPTQSQKARLRPGFFFGPSAQPEARFWGPAVPPGRMTATGNPAARPYVSFPSASESAQ